MHSIHIDLLGLGKVVRALYIAQKYQEPRSVCACVCVRGGGRVEELKCTEYTI